ncbi:alcohol dehydrogenase catalytic domain-containing protein [Streptomyces sp. NPDC008092]|uniref:NAD(P)-dependent alcohol dehydrogenase n=1 Tax=Streptomyces sp. NPDC008092 TaxID=3364808 RepID=UPI0036E7FE86
MLAYRLLQPQGQPEFQEVPDPHAGPGQVVVRVAGSGLCHTDFTVIGRDASYWRTDPPPFTLGHEVAGWVEEVGSGVTNFRPGDAVAIDPSWASCGHCHMCRSGEENHCYHQKGIRAPGVGFDGGHAPYILVPDARFLVPIGDLDPVEAAPLTDAGITTYAAIKPAIPKIWPGSTAVVIGAGGLGLYAIQFLRLLTGARVVAVDSSDARLKLARELGADEVLADGPDTVKQIRELTGGIGATFVLDCVGVDATLALGVAVLSWRGSLTMVGAGGGAVPFDFFKVPPGTQLATSLNGGSIALREVVGLAALGRLRILVDRYPLGAAQQAYEDFKHGRLVGRAVLMPAQD